MVCPLGAVAWLSVSSQSMRVMSDIMEGDALGGAEDADREADRFDAAWAALGDGPAWRALTPEDVPGAQAAYRQSERVVGRLRGLLDAVGIGGADLPGLWPSLDAQGRPVVWLGTLSVAGADRLAAILEREIGRSRREAS